MKTDKIVKVAIIGAGLSGLSLAWHLIDSGRCLVTLFDPHGIGKGASGIAAGLMHPYPGEQGKRSFLATEAMAAAKKLLRIAERKSALPLANAKGIIRYPQNAEMRSLFLSHAEKFEDIEPYDQEGFLILSGMTIFCRRYLEGLWLAVKERGALLEKKKIHALSELSSYDHIVLAAGAGVRSFAEAQSLRLELLKGQILKCRIPEGIPFPEQSVIGKGYIAHAAEKHVCYIGSSYERGVLNPDPDLEKAKREILPKTLLFYPPAASFSIMDCQAAFRVMRIGHYYPMAGKLTKNTWICTALGSRGLLYHGILGEWLKRAILDEEKTILPKEFSLNRELQS